MVYLIIALIIVLAFGTAELCILQNHRDIEKLDKKVERQTDTVNTSHEFYDAQIAEIINRMTDVTNKIGKLDELDTRVKQADAKASDALRILVLNGMDTKPNSGVQWASEYPDEEETK